MMTTLRREVALAALVASTDELLSAARAAWLDFLRIELALAQTLLDMAVNAREETARKRRIARAAEAAAVVQRFVAEPPPPVRLPDAERTQLATELDRVQERLTSMR